MYALKHTTDVYMYTMHINLCTCSHATMRSYTLSSSSNTVQGSVLLPHYRTLSYARRPTCIHTCINACIHTNMHTSIHTCIRAFAHKGEIIGRMNRKREGEENSERGKENTHPLSTSEQKWRRIDARLEFNVIELSGVRRQEQDKQVTTLWPRDAYSHCEGVLVHTMV